MFYLSPHCDQRPLYLNLQQDDGKNFDAHCDIFSLANIGVWTRTLASSGSAAARCILIVSPKVSALWLVIQTPGTGFMDRLAAFHEILLNCFPSGFEYREGSPRKGRKGPNPKNIKDRIAKANDGFKSSGAKMSYSSCFPHRSWKPT